MLLGFLGQQNELQHEVLPSAIISGKFLIDRMRKKDEEQSLAALLSLSLIYKIGFDAALKGSKRLLNKKNKIASLFIVCVCVCICILLNKIQ